MTVRSSGGWWIRWRSSPLLLLLGLVPARGDAAPQGPANTRTTSSRERVIVVGLPDVELTARIVAELRFLGLAPEVVPSPPSKESLDLSELARSADAEAAIRIDPSIGLVEIWIADHTSDGLGVRELTTSVGTDSSRDLAVWTAELLRTLLAEVGPEPPPVPVGPKPRPPTAPPAPERPPSRFGFVVAAGLGGAPGGGLVAPYARAQLRHMPHPNVGVMVTGTTMLRTVDVGANADAARLRTGALAVGARFALRRPEAIVMPDLSVAIGAVLVDMRSAAAAGPRTLAVDARLEGSAGLEVRLSPRVRLRGELVVGACTRTIRVRFSGEPVAAWCSPHALGVLGLAVVLR